MISGIGIDLCRISRIEKAIKSGHFIEKVFSPEEIEYAESKGKRRAESYASSFAAREAFCKASGESLGSVVFENNFSLIRNKNGAPEIKLSGRLAKLTDNAKIFVSITHEGDYACAVAVIEKI